MITPIAPGRRGGPRGPDDAPWTVRAAAWLAVRRAPDVLDGLLAAACFAAFTLPVLLGSAGPPAEQTGLGPAASPALVAFFGLAATVPLVLRRRWPLPVLAVVALACGLAPVAGVTFTPFVSSTGPALAIAAFTVADRCPRRTSGIAVGVVALGTWLLVIPAARLHPGLAQDASQPVTAVIAWLAGDMARSPRQYRQELAAYDRRRASEAHARARAEERLALSREVHDVVSHSLSLIAVRSGVARLVAAERPGEAQAALAAIEVTSRQALDEVRALLRQVRDTPAATEPLTPALADLPGLAGRLRAAGLDLAADLPGPQAGCDLATATSAYRIVQEALTNVVRHAPGARARLEVRREPAELVISVTNDAPGPADAAPSEVTHPAGTHPAAGLGIAGMRERAALLGGQLTAQPRPGGGFAVTARLPLRPPAGSAE